MAEQKLDQREILEQQKSQCPFCKIIKGDIPSKKIYEDDKLLAILDINPVKEGHILLMPKEHYPIMPLIPQETLDKLFMMTRRLAEIVRLVFERSGTTIFVANGGVAGQQSAHFMLHIIPRDDGDGIDNFDINEGLSHPDKHKELFEVLLNNLPELLRERYAKYPLKDNAGNPLSLSRREKRFSKSQVFGIIDNNPQIKELIMKEPEQFVMSIEKSPQLKQLFSGLNVHEIVKEINPKYKKRDIVQAEFKEEVAEPDEAMPIEKPKENPKGKKKPAKGQPAKEKEQPVKEPAPVREAPTRVDLDLISRMF